MEIINKITFDMAAAGMPPYIDAVQGDTLTRKVEVTLMTRGQVFDPSDGFVSVSVAFKKPDGTAGWYDTLPDGNIATTVISDGVYQVSLAPEMFSVAGSVYALFRFDLDGKTVSTFPFFVRVSENPSFNSSKSENYYNVQTWDAVNASFDEIFDRLAKLEQSGGSAEGAVLYTPQTLTDEQQEQARENIGAVGEDAIFDAVLSANLLDMNSVEHGSVVDAAGKIYSGYANYLTTALIPCKPGDVFRMQYTYYGNRYDSTEIGYIVFNRVCAYGENGTSAVDFQQGQSTYTVPDGTRYVRFSLLVSYFSQEEYSDISIIIQDYATKLPYSEYGAITSRILKPEFLPTAPAPLAFLPDEICVAVGRTIEIYNNQVCPLADKYHFRWVCNIGKALKRKFSITGTDTLVGNHSLTLEIYNDQEEIVYGKTTTLKIVTDTITTAKTICPIGDSLTNLKYWLKEVENLNPNITFVGTRSGSTYDTSANPVQAYTVQHEGRSGWTSAMCLRGEDYSYEGEGVHPFWDGSKFSWAYYKTNTGINPSAVQIFLGTNDLFGNTTPEEFSNNIKTMVDSIRADDANIPIFVVLTILPGNQNGIGVQQSNDGFASQKGKYKFGLDCKIVKAMQVLHDSLKSYTNLYFVPLAECHDSEYNFGAVETPVNPRASQKELMPTEGVHPQQQGYEQIADIMYSVFCAKLGN